MDILRQSACMIINLILVDNFVSSFNCTLSPSVDYQRLRSGPSWSCFWFSCVLASDHHWALSLFCHSIFDYLCFCDASQMRQRTTCAYMCIEHMSIIWSCIRIKGEVSRDKTEDKTGSRLGYLRYLVTRYAVSRQFYCLRMSEISVDRLKYEFELLSRSPAYKRFVILIFHRIISHTDLSERIDTKLVPTIVLVN